MKPLEKAIAIAVKAHARQTDKAGAPYILHPLRMMLRMENDTEMMAAVLHDVVEDGPGWTFERLTAEGIPAAVVEAVTHLTKRPEDEKNYEGFIRRAATNPVARRVKLADLEDNMDLRRIENPTEKDFARLAKYRSAYTTLKSLSEVRNVDYRSEACSLQGSTRSVAPAQPRARRQRNRDPQNKLTGDPKEGATTTAEGRPVEQG